MLKRIGAEESGEFKAIASGTLPSGRPVVVNSDGTVSVISGSAASVGSAAQPEASGSQSYGTAAFDSNANKFVVAYRDNSNSQYGTAVVGTVSGSSISFGTPVVIKSAEAEYLSAVYDSNAQKVVIAFTDNGNSQYGTAVVGTISGTSISFGSESVFESAQSNAINAVYEPNAQKIVISYTDGGNSAYGTAVIGTVSGTSISFGTPVVYNSGNSFQNSIAYDANAQKVVIVYRNYGNSDYGTAIVGTVSGTSISFGSAAIFESGGAAVKPAVAYNSNTQKNLIIWSDNANGGYGTAVVGTVSGTSISFGTAVVFAEVNTSSGHGIVYDPDNQKIIIAYKDNTNSPYPGYFIDATISGTSVSFGTATEFHSAYGNIAPSNSPLIYDTNADKAVVIYQDGNSSSELLAKTLSISSTNLTSENYIGMSRGVISGTSATQALGTSVVFESGTVTYHQIVYDAYAQKVVIAYRDGGNSGYGTAIVGTVSGNSISFGSPVVFESANSNYVTAAYDSNAQKIVISYRDGGNSNYGTAIVGTVSGTSISFGSPAVFYSGDPRNISITYDSNAQKAVISYRDAGNSSYGTAIVGTVSGTSISFGSAVVFESAASFMTQNSIVYDSNAQKVVIAYHDTGNSDHGTAIVGTVSGTSISFGSAVVYYANTTAYPAITYDSNSQKVVIGYRADGNSNYGTAIVGTVSGTSISFGSSAVFESAEANYTAMGYDPNAQKIIISYRDETNSAYGTLVVGTVSGTSISFGTPVVYEEASTSYSAVTYDSNNKKIIISNGGTNSKARVFQAAYENITRAEVANSGNASIDIIGSVSDNQVNLTAGQQYFVQTDGTISTTADSPSVLAGTAISATELLVKT